MKSENKGKYNPNITKKDKHILGDKPGNLRNDTDDDQLLKTRNNEVDFAGKDLDIPGRNLSNQTKKKSLKDEENKHYSLGSMHNDNLEQTNDPNTK